MLVIFTRNIGYGRTMIKKIMAHFMYNQVDCHNYTINLFLNLIQIIFNLFIYFFWILHSIFWQSFNFIFLKTVWLSVLYNVCILNYIIYGILSHLEINFKLICRKIRFKKKIGFKSMIISNFFNQFLLQFFYANLFFFFSIN